VLRMSYESTFEDSNYEDVIKNLSTREHKTLCHVFRKWSDSSDPSKRSIYENIMRRDFRLEGFVKYLSDIWNREREEVDDFFLFSNELCDV
jgi:hypothetical protein